MMSLTIKDDCCLLRGVETREPFLKDFKQLQVFQIQRLVGYKTVIDQLINPRGSRLQVQFVDLFDDEYDAWYRVYVRVLSGVDEIKVILGTINLQ